MPEPVNVGVAHASVVGLAIGMGVAAIGKLDGGDDGRPVSETDAVARSDGVKPRSGLLGEDEAPRTNPDSPDYSR